MELLKDLGFLGAAFSVFFVIRFHIGEREEGEVLKKELRAWWEENPNEKNFRSRVRFFLDEYPFPRSKRQQKKFRKNLREVQIFLEKELFREDKISFKTYEELVDAIEEKKKKISFN